MTGLPSKLYIYYQNTVDQPEISIPRWMQMTLCSEIRAQYPATFAGEYREATIGIVMYWIYRTIGAVEPFVYWTKAEVRKYLWSWTNQISTAHWQSTLGTTGIWNNTWIARTTGENMLYSILFLGLLSFASCSDVLEFTDSDFAGKIVNVDLALVEFFAPW